MENKYVLCRPEGGLNDMLCQIGKCFDYCIKSGRRLIIDTASTETFSERFENHFAVVNKNIFLPSDMLGDLKKSTMNFYPSFVCWDHAKPRPSYSPGVNYSIGGKAITFDFEKSYDEDVLIHHQCGGGSPSKSFLKVLRLNRETRNYWEKRKLELPKRYIGFHVRNTDIASNLDGITNLIKATKLPIFLATDSVETQMRFREIRPKDVYCSSIPDFGGRPLHHEGVGAVEKTYLNRISILDLLSLAFADKVYCSTHLSGFGKLAMALNKNKLIALRIVSEGKSVGMRQIMFDVCLGSVRRVLCP